MAANIDYQKEEMASRLRGSLHEFTRFFTKYITNRDYIQSQPIGRESHQITICRELSAMTRLEHPDENLLINVEPGSGKSLHICMWVAWCYAINPQCNFIYISYSQTLAAEQTAFIRLIMSSEMYGHLFGVYLSRDTKAKDHFATTEGGHVAAFGSEGAVTGRNAGLPGQVDFSGAVIIDDAHKPDEAHSDTLREKVIRNYKETIRQRPRGFNVPIIFVGQRVHEADLAAFLIEDKDTKKWRKVILRALDDSGNALYPEVHPREYLLELQSKSPYVYASQFDQNPNPAGGGLFRPDWFLELDKDPEFILTFVTIDSAETEKTYNDPTAMSFLGLYEIELFGKKTGQLALHCIDTLEDWIDAKDLEDRVLDFLRECSRHKTPPQLVCIEKKSTGVTLIASLNKIQGIKVMDVQRTAASGSKTARYIEMQPYAASKCMTFTFGARHVANVKKHMGKITANNTHRHDDICDTLYDGVKIGLIDKLLHKIDSKGSSADEAMNAAAQNMRRLQQLRMNRNGLR
jgi:predicted phage terminase large subunit-like protein